MTTTVAFSQDIHTEINVDETGELESITLYNAQDMPRMVQHQIMTSAHRAWRKQLGDDRLAVIEAFPVEKGENWSRFRAFRHMRSTER